jgi:GT2 family glycosyltransferase
VKDAAEVGVVVIGRNEGERLKQCIASLSDFSRRTVYIDSGSSDGSLEHARSAGCDVVLLDSRLPFTAARARNEGFRRLRTLHADVGFVQFVDGDCEVTKGWLEKAHLFLSRNPDVAAVCGRLREKFPDRTIYNMLCDLEWDTPIGESRSCGGIAMLRVDAFERMNGYRSDLIAGEEPELCVRLRAAGWRVWRLDEEMALHDAAISRFPQWWKRTLRGGYAFAQGAHLHGATPERHCIRESRRIWLWGLGIPIAAAIAAAWLGAGALIILAIYPLQIMRLSLRGGRDLRSRREKWWHACFLVLGKFPEVIGQLKFLIHRHLGGQSRLIEYK